MDEFLRYLGIFYACYAITTVVLYIALTIYERVRPRIRRWQRRRETVKREREMGEFLASMTDRERAQLERVAAHIVDVVNASAISIKDIAP